MTVTLRKPLEPHKLSSYLLFYYYFLAYTLIYVVLGIVSVAVQDQSMLMVTNAATQLLTLLGLVILIVLRAR